MPDVAGAIAPNRLRELVDMIAATLDDRVGGSTLAGGGPGAPPEGR
jgi:hypothetical protein